MKTTDAKGSRPPKRATFAKGPHEKKLWIKSLPSCSVATTTRSKRLFGRATERGRRAQVPAQTNPIATQDSQRKALEDTFEGKDAVETLNNAISTLLHRRELCRTRTNGRRCTRSGTCPRRQAGVEALAREIQKKKEKKNDPKHSGRVGERRGGIEEALKRLRRKSTGEIAAKISVRAALQDISNSW